MKKRVLAMAVALMLLAAGAYAAEDSGYRFAAEDLGFRVVIDRAWVDAVQDGKLSFWLRQDEGAARGGVRGYGVVYLTPDLSGYTGFATYDEAEAWLNENALALGVVAAHQEDASLGALFPDFERGALGSAGKTFFTLMRPGAVDENRAGEWSDLAAAVRDALGQPGAVALFDPDTDYGPLGMFEAETLGMVEAETLNGETLGNDYFAEAPLTVVNFWATYCTACLGEMPTLGDLAREYAGRVGFLGVATDVVDADSLALAAEIVQKTGVEYPNILPQVSPEVLAQIQYVPTTIFVDASGHQVGEIVVGGADWQTEIESRLAMLS